MVEDGVVTPSAKTWHLLRAVRRRPGWSTSGPSFGGGEGDEGRCARSRGTSPGWGEVGEEFGVQGRHAGDHAGVAATNPCSGGGDGGRDGVAQAPASCTSTRCATCWHGSRITVAVASQAGRDRRGRGAGPGSRTSSRRCSAFHRVDQRPVLGRRWFGSGRPSSGRSRQAMGWQAHGPKSDGAGRGAGLGLEPPLRSQPHRWRLLHRRRSARSCPKSR